MTLSKIFILVLFAAGVAHAQPTAQSWYYTYLDGEVTSDTLDRNTATESPWIRPTQMIDAMWIRIVSTVQDTIHVYRRTRTGAGLTLDTTTVIPMLIYQPMLTATVDTSGAAYMKKVIGSAKFYAQFRIYDMYVFDYFYIDFGSVLKNGTAYYDIVRRIKGE